MNTEKVKNLIGRDLSSFKIIEMMEVYTTDDDARKSTSLGYFKDPNIAAAFVGSLPDAHWHRTSPAFVLTDGKVGFIVNVEEVKLFDDEAEALRIRKEILSKLTTAERKILGV